MPWRQILASAARVQEAVHVLSSMDRDVKPRAAAAQSPELTDSVERGAMSVQSTNVPSSIDERLQLLKELVSAALALAIVGTTLYFAGAAFGLAGDTTRMHDAKDLLAGMTGLTGVVLGYYFGRVPSEARASQAQRQIEGAVIERDRVQASSQRVDEML
jgi:hypothetical protein